MCLNEPYSKVHISKHLSDICPIQHGLKQGDALSLLLENSRYNVPSGRSKRKGIGIS
jgi:hypothetical protein